MHMNMSQNGAINHEKNIVSFILEELIVSQWIWAWSTPHLVLFLNEFEHDPHHVHHFQCKEFLKTWSEMDL
jgi:hypothetical protein